MAKSTANDNLAWLKKWFSREGGSLPDNFDECNYFESGLIDSFGLIELISAMEQEFVIKFNDKSFKDPRFNTPLGLSQLIEELSAN